MMDAETNPRRELDDREAVIACEQSRAHLDQLFDAAPAELVSWPGDAVNAGVSEHVGSCVACRGYLTELRRLAAAVDSLGAEKCPEAVIERVLAATSGGGSVAVFEARAAGERVGGSWSGRWGALLAAAGILAVAVLGWAAINRSNLGFDSGASANPERAIAEVPAEGEALPERMRDGALLAELEAAGYSPEDLARAEKEARLALALLGAVSQRTTLAVDRVLRDRVAGTPRRTIERILESKEPLDA